MKTVEITYSTSKQYKRVHATGAYGLATVAHEVLFDLFQEFPDFPKTEIREIDGDGLVTLKTPTTETIHITRERLVGVTMSLKTSKEFYEWLGEKIKEVERIVEMTKEGRSGEDTHEMFTSDKVIIV